MGNSQRKARPAAIFALIGVGLVGAAWGLLLTSEGKGFTEMLAESLLAIGFAVLTVVILQLLWGVLGGEPIERMLVELRETVSLVEDGHRTGLRQIWATSGSFGSETDWLTELRRCRRSGQVDLMGYTLASWLAGDFRETVQDLLADGVTVRALMMAPDNPVFGKRGNPGLPEQSPGRLKEDVTAASTTFRQLSEAAAALKGSFEYRQVTSGSIKWQVTRVDGTMMVVPYMYSSIGSSCPLMRVSQTDDGKGLFATFTREFDTLWNTAPQIHAPAEAVTQDTRKPETATAATTSDAEGATGPA